MAIVHKLLPGGGFVVGDTITRQTAYAYPTSSHAATARLRNADAVATEMAREANENPKVCPPHILDPYNARNWAKLGE